MTGERVCDEESRWWGVSEIALACLPAKLWQAGASAKASEQVATLVMIKIELLPCRLLNDLIIRLFSPEIL